MVMRPLFLLHAALVVTALTLCCTRSQAGNDDQEGRTTVVGAAVVSSAVPAPSQIPPMRFTRHHCIDTEGLGIEAFSVLLPAGWRFEGGIHWRLDNPAFPAYVSCRISDPDGLTAFEVFPNLPYFWTDNPMVARMFPPGSKYFGSTVHPPVTAGQALRELVLPAFRGHAGGLQVTGERQAPELARMVYEMQARAQPEAGIRTDAASVDVRYVAGGQAFEEEMFAVVQMFAYPIASMAGTFTNRNWWVDYVFSLRAPAGLLGEASKMLRTVAFSFRVDPRWFAAYSNVVEYLIRRQIQQIRTIGEIGRIYAQTGSEIRDDQMRSWEANQAVRDRMSKEWSQAFRGVEEYYDPIAEKTVELPTGYDNAWVTPLGEVVVSGDPSFNPNIGSNQTWQPMKKK